MLSPRLHAVTCSSPAGLHRMAYHEWGDPENPEVVLCVHGLTRTGRDFDSLARVLSDRYRVVCPDVVGRGLSDWLMNPAFYAVPQYASDMVTLIARLKPTRLHWIGTSMGGLIGMVFGGLIAHSRASRSNKMALHRFTALPQTNLRLDSMVLNDVGPHIEHVSLERIGHYVGEDVQFASFQQAIEYMRETCASFGTHTDEQWADLTRYVFAEHSGKWCKSYDLGIASAFKNLQPERSDQGENLLWSAYGSIPVPIQIIRGEHSDLLSMQTCEKMLRMQPGARLEQIPDVGHAPTLIKHEQISLIDEFLLSTDKNSPSDFGS